MRAPERIVRRGAVQCKGTVSIPPMHRASRFVGELFHPCQLDIPGASHAPERTWRTDITSDIPIAVGGLETYDSPYFGFTSVPVYPVK